MENECRGFKGISNLHCMKIFDLTSYLESVAPLSLQEDYDNAGLLIGDPKRECTGVLCTLDVTEDVINEALRKNCNCIVAHHPLIFKGLKKLSGDSAVEKTVIAAIKNDMAVYASHTNLDNIIKGVNGKIAAKLGLKNFSVLEQKNDTLLKLNTFVPKDHIDKVRDALFAAGAGEINNYSECSFSYPGTGTFKAEEGAEPFSGKIGERKYEEEIKLEVILPGHLKSAVVRALLTTHPYEEVAYDVIGLQNSHPATGAGVIGEIDAMGETDFLAKLHDVFNDRVVRHTPLTGKDVKKVAICGGAGSFLIAKALKAGADVFVTADVKYHEFFGAEGRMLLCDIGHYESEQFTTDLFIELLREKFPTFAVLKSEINTNPVLYFTGK